MDGLLQGAHLCGVVQRPHAIGVGDGGVSLRCEQRAPDGAQARGNLFISPKTEVYKDMIVGVHQRPGDLAVNVCKTKQLTNMRSATKGITEGLTPPIEMSLDSMVEYIQDDEVVEVTPSHMRMSKKPGWDQKRANNRG